MPTSTFMLSVSNQPYIKEVVKTLFAESSRKWWGGETASEAKSFSTSVRKRERKAINFWISKKSSLTIPERGWLL